MTAETAPQTPEPSLEADPVASYPTPPPPAHPARRVLALAAIGVVLALALYYPVGAWRAHVIDDDMGFAPSGLKPNQSIAVATGAALLHREIDVHGWTPNRPFFMPAAILDDMPNFQTGIAAAVGRFAIVMDETIGRDAGASAADADLDRAAGLLQYPPDVWMVNPAVPWATTISTEKQYRNAARSLEAYNLRLGNGQAAFSHRPEVLQTVIERFAKDLDASAASLDGPSSGDEAWRPDQRYFAAKGRAYADFLLLRGLGADYAELIAERGLSDRWQAMLASLQTAAQPRPLFVLTGDADSLFVPNHLAIQGFHLLRARARLTELAEALR